MSDLPIDFSAAYACRTSPDATPYRIVIPNSISLNGNVQFSLILYENGLDQPGNSPTLGAMPITEFERMIAYGLLEKIAGES